MHPELFDLPLRWIGFENNLPVTSYGAMLVLAFFVTTGLALWIGPKLGFKSIDISDYVFIAMVSGLIGARLLIGLEEPTPMFYPRYVNGGVPEAGDIMPADLKISASPGWIRDRYAAQTQVGQGQVPSFELDYIGTNRINLLTTQLGRERQAYAEQVAKLRGQPVYDSAYRRLLDYDRELQRLQYLREWYDTNKSQFLQPWEIFKIWQGGLTFYGGAIAGVLMTIWFTKRRKIPLREFWDFCAPFLALGLAIGRIGCHLNGCCQGSYTDFLGIRFPADAGAINEYTLHQFGYTCNLVPLHPAQLYSVIIDLLLAAYLFALYPYRNYPGQISVHCMALYIPMRIVLELIRTEPGLAGGLTPSMWVGVVMIPLPIWWYFRWSKAFVNHPGAQTNGTAAA